DDSAGQAAAGNRSRVPARLGRALRRARLSHAARRAARRIEAMMPPGLTIAVICGVLFGALLWVLPPLKLAILLAGAALTITLLRRPLWGLLLFAVLATSLPYTTVQVGIRTTI